MSDDADHEDASSTASHDENDINVFRRVHPSAELSRGRSITQILYERSIHGPRGAGGVRSSLVKQKAALVMASPSSVIPPTGTARSNTDIDEVDSLAEVLGESASSVLTSDSLSEVLSNTSNGAGAAPADNESDESAPPSCLLRGNGNPANEVQAPNIRLKMNAYPTNISNEIGNYVEQYSVTKFNADYLSLDKIKVPPPTQPNSRHETFRRRVNADETEFAISTISIAFSPDGRTVASTHGDHTVKISCCNTGALIRSLEGHPRTPWTVKYHPTQSNIVASGCLGHQVRIWDWNHPINGKNGKNENNVDDEETDAQYNYHERKGVCLKMIRLRNSIISLSFHPTGSILAIACGHTLHLWVYDNESKTQASIGGNDDAEAHEGGNGFAEVNEERNDEAEANEEGNGEGNEDANGNQTNGQTVLHQIRYANNLRCVHFPPGGDTIIIGGVNPNSDSANAHDTSYSLLLLDFDLDVALMSPKQFNYFQSIDPEDRRPKPSVEVLKNYRTFLPRALLYNDGGFDISKDGKKLCGCADLWLPFGVDSAAELIEREENEKIASMERSFNDTSLQSKPSRKDRKKRKDIDVETTEPLDCPYNSPPRQGTLPPVGDCLTPPNPSRPDPTSPPSPPGRRWVSHLDRPQGRGNKSRYQHGADTLPPMQSSRRLPTGGRYVPHVVVVSLDDQANALGESTLGKVLEATPLGSKSTSVTCVKFSPSAEFCLLGYGVREQGQNAFGLPYHPVNALYRVQGGMTQVATMLSGDDDVNIARFHPESGVGFVYGTKQGRVRVLGPRPWNYYYD